jgi:hypothetical protein
MILNKVTPAAGVAVGASAVDTAVSATFAPLDPYHVLARVRLSAVSQTTGISFSLKETCDDSETFQAVGSESSVSVTKKTFTAGTAEVSTITWPAFAGATQADYLHVTAQDGTTFAIWLDKDANGTAPTGALYVAATYKIEVDIVTGDTAAQVTTKARAAIVAESEFTDRFTVGAAGAPTDDDIVFTQILGGAVADPAPKSENDGGAGSISVAVGTAGANGGCNLSTEAITSSTHGFVTGDRVIVHANGGTLPAGLTAGTYYVIRTDANTLKLASSYANAIAGTVATNMTDYGLGTCAIYAADYEIRMIIEDATDAAQLPVWQTLVVVANTGTSDSCTVSAVYVPVPN